jgi:protocatechuate 3,4-dioxygenase beta subunit
MAPRRFPIENDQSTKMTKFTSFASRAVLVEVAVFENVGKPLPHEWFGVWACGWFGVWMTAI